MINVVVIIIINVDCHKKVTFPMLRLYFAHALDSFPNKFARLLVWPN